jgi:membrane protease YdiL (CAAX protease family)
LFVACKNFVWPKIFLGRFDWTAIPIILATPIFATILYEIISAFTFNYAFSFSNAFTPSCKWLVFRDTDFLKLRAFEFLAVMSALYICQSLTVPLLEEVLYRGLWANALTKSTGIWTAAMVSSAAFSTAHRDFSFLWLYYFAMGMAYFAARQRFGGILVPLAMHVFLNSAFDTYSILLC